MKMSPFALLISLFFFSGGESLSKSETCEAGAVSWKIVSSCMKPVSNAYAGMIMTGVLDKDTLLSSLQDACRLSWPGFETCAKGRLESCGLDLDLASQLGQSSMCLGDKPRKSLLDLVATLPKTTDVSCVTQDEEERFHPCVVTLFSGGRPKNMFLKKNRSVVAGRYVSFIKCAVDLIEGSSCKHKRAMSTVFTVFGMTTAPSGVLVTTDELESLGLLKSR